MAGFDAEAARRSHSLATGQDPACVVAIGRIGKLQQHNDSMRKRDAATRERLALADLVSRQQLGDPSPIIAAPSVAR
jgi:hypothetical protein